MNNRLTRACYTGPADFLGHPLVYAVGKSPFSGGSQNRR